MDQARLFDETVGGSLRAFLQWAALQAEDDRRSGGVGPPDADDDAVRVMTIHGSKGLEFPVVILAGLEREVASGQRPPVVLWSEDGTPELRGSGQLKSFGFDEAHRRERDLDALEQHRLLYVGMTRARDHLVLCLHHKALGENSSATPTEAARVLEICQRSPQLWRRLPIEALTTDDASDETTTSEELARVRAGFGLDRDKKPGSGAGATTDDATVAAWRRGVESFAARRHTALASTRRAPVTTATAISDALVRPHPPGSGSIRRPDDSGARWHDADTSLRIGRAVHGALAAIDLTTGTDDAGRSAADVARARATSHGVDAHAEAVVAMVAGALSAPTVAGTTARHWRELYVAVPVGDGVLEGFVDLVLEDGEGLVVVDYKTDVTGGDAGLGAVAARYRPQLASYALALEEATRRPVHRCVLVFVGDGDPVEAVLEGAELDEARTVAQHAAQDLVRVR
jgi:ATP-dependent exoDNAse (exonuclease V) beta subunit